ncbi:IclR family transcriptional regulator [Streptomyces sp. NPDC006733]|uniref:IclR family transcriptional regulator n=1 Tax=Streptomyces sp. NPDC006733 TaxID=3155460 RepID=UPI0033D94CBF
MRQSNDFLERPAPVPPGDGGRGVLQGAFGLLEAVDRAGEARLTQLATQSGLPKSTTYRLLEQLVELGAVQRSGTGYRMGPEMFRLGQEWQPHPGLRAAADEPVRRLAAATGTTVGISVLCNGETLVVLWAPGGDRALPPPRRGTPLPWFTAAGKVLVAGAHPALPLDPLPAAWRREAELIRDRGVAFDREQVTAGVCCVAVPLYSTGGVPVASLCVLTDPAHHLEQLADAVRVAGRAISAGLRGQ